MHPYIRHLIFSFSILTTPVLASQFPNDGNDEIGRSLKRALATLKSQPSKHQKTESFEGGNVKEDIKSVLKRSIQSIDENPSKYQKFQSSEDGEVSDHSNSEEQDARRFAQMFGQTPFQKQHCGTWVLSPRLDQEELYKLNLLVFNIFNELMDMHINLDCGNFIDDASIRKFRKLVKNSQIEIVEVLGNTDFCASLTKYFLDLSELVTDVGLTADCPFPSSMAELGKNPANQSEFNMLQLYRYVTREEGAQVYEDFSRFVNEDPETQMERMSLPKRYGLSRLLLEKMTDDSLAPEERLKAAQDASAYSLWSFTLEEEGTFADVFSKLQDYASAARLLNKLFEECGKDSKGSYNYELFSYADWLFLNTQAGNHEKVDEILQYLIKGDRFDFLKRYENRVFKRKTSLGNYQAVVDAVTFLLPARDKRDILSYLQILELCYEAVGDFDEQAGIARRMLQEVDSLSLAPNKKAAVFKRCLKIFFNLGHYQEAEKLIDQLLQGGKMPVTVSGGVIVDITYSQVGRMHEADVIFGYLYQNKNCKALSQVKQNKLIFEQRYRENMTDTKVLQDKLYESHQENLRACRTSKEKLRKENREALIQAYKIAKESTAYLDNPFLINHVAQRLKELGVQ